MDSSISQQTAYLITFIIYFVVIAALCIIANQRNNKLSDYVLGGRSLSGPIAALGAGASDMGGWLLLALPGAVFAFGLNQIWMPIGLFIGAYFNWRFVSYRLRSYTEIANNSLTIPAYLDNRFKDNSTFLRAITAMVVLIFFTFYAAAGFVSGAVLFQTAFHLNYQTSLWIGATIVMVYTAVGGFLALSWIDFFQGSLMFFALLITPVVIYHHLGSVHSIISHLDHISPKYLHPFADISAVGVVSLLGWGLGYFGQPHILVRFMAVKSVKELPSARRICMIWMGLSLIGAVAVGMLGHAFFLHGLNNPEKIFLSIAKSLFASLVAGILLSAVLSAVMSTVSAQLLAASSALTADFYSRFVRRNASQQELVIISRLCVVAIAVVAILIASNPSGNILQLVSYAWAGLGAAFGPVILFSLFWKRMTRNASIAGILVGTLTVIIWRMVISHMGGWFHMYEIIPGFIMATLVIVIVSLIDAPPSADMTAEFEIAKANCK